MDFQLREKGISLLSIIESYVAIDIETTGWDPKYDEIIEIGAVKYTNDNETEHFQSLVKPINSIPAFITEKTGITNEMVKGAPDICTVLPEFMNFISDDILLGHNIHFDINFLYDVLMICQNQKLQNNFVDTLRIARRLFKDLENHKLDTLINFFGFESRGLHRSIGDSVAAAKCYKSMKQFIYDHSIDIEKLLSAKRTNKVYLKASDIKPDTIDCDPDHPLYNKTCVFTGALEKMIRKDAMQIVVNLGGINGDGVTKKTNFLILGNNDYCSSIKDGKSSKHKKAEKLILEGNDLQIISENVFYDLISIT